MNPLRWRSAMVLLAASASCVLAQGREALSQPTVVPIDLVTALISSAGVPGPGTPRILVGSAPEWVLPRIAIPSGARIVGAAFWGTTVLTIVNVPSATDSVIEQARQALLARGWKIPPPPNAPPTGGGFRPARVAAVGPGMPLDRTTLCDGTQSVIASVVRRDGTSADIAYRIFTISGVGGICNPYRYPPQTARLVMPTLYSPPASLDAAAMVECSQNFGGSSGTTTMLRTAMPPEQVMDHFAAQLVDSGWKPASDKNTTVGRTFTRADSTGAPFEVALTITTPPRTELCREVNMQVRPLRKP